MENNVIIAWVLGVSLLGVGTVLRPERDAWSMVKLLRQENKWVRPPPRSVKRWFNRKSAIEPLSPVVAHMKRHCSGEQLQWGSPEKFDAAPAMASSSVQPTAPGIHPPVHQIHPRSTFANQPTYPLIH